MPRKMEGNSIESYDIVTIGIVFLYPRVNLPATGIFTRLFLAGSFFALFTTDRPAEMNCRRNGNAFPGNTFPFPEMARFMARVSNSTFLNSVLPLSLFCITFI